jgi:hypothetical protein
MVVSFFVLFELGRFVSWLWVAAPGGSRCGSVRLVSLYEIVSATVTVHHKSFSCITLCSDCVRNGECCRAPGDDADVLTRYVSFRLGASYLAGGIRLSLASANRPVTEIYLHGYDRIKPNDVGFGSLVGVG